MKPIAWLSLLLALAAFSCAPTASEPPAVTPAMAARSGKSEGRLQVGRALYLAHCGRCHEMQMPETVSDEDWHVVVPGMAWNAGLSKQDEKALHDYLIAAKATP